jgi:hypothetical protein
VAKKIKDLSPKLEGLLPAEQELALPPGTVEIGQRIGGISSFANAFKRGYGDQVFGVSEKGMWLGAADFEDAPFRVDMLGNMYFQTEDGAIVIDAVNKRIVFYEGEIPVGFIGFQEDAF